MSNEPAQPAPERLVLLNRIGGHHRAYGELFHNLFDMDIMVGRSIPNFSRLLRSGGLLYATLDDDILGFTVVALARALIGRRTAGVFLQPHSCFAPGFHGWCKRQWFKMLKRVPKVATLSILPFDILTRLSAVASHSVHDPQIWDLIDHHHAVDAAMAEAMTAVAKGRPIVAFIGTVTTAKGFPLLAGMIAANPELTKEFCIIIAGQVKDDVRVDAAAAQDAGAIIWDRRVSDGELDALYLGSTAVWACYRKGYDQASGIFGRAVQRKRLPIVADDAKVVGSYVERLGLDAIRLPSEPELAGVRLLNALTGPKFTRYADLETLRAWRGEFIDTVQSVIDDGPLA